MTTLSSIAASDLISASRAVINGNLQNLNAGKVETTVTDAFLGAWTAYTPTLSGGWLSAGNAIFDCKYVQIGKTVIVQIIIVNGSSTTYQAGNLTFSLPVTATTSDVAFIGTAYYQETGVSSYANMFIKYTSTTAGVAIQGAGGVFVAAGTATNLLPFTCGDTDVIRGTLIYEAA